MHAHLEQPAYRSFPAPAPAPMRPRPASLRPATTRRTAPALATVPLIDREHETAELRAALDATLAGSGRVVLLAGEPGIGKTRLASVLAGEAEARGVPVWWGRGWEEGSAPAFWPWSTALRRWLDRVGPDAVAAAADPWRAELAHVFPVLRAPAVKETSGASGESSQERFRLFDIVRRFLAGVASPAGLVVVLDDLHWADPASLRLLEFVAASVQDARLMVVATYRDTEVERDHPLATTLSRLAREPAARRLLLTGLAPGHCARWIAAAGIAGDATALGDAMHRETSGNPFFVGEIVRLLASEGGLGTGWDPRRMPQGLREVITRRLGRLGDACRGALEVAALVGDTVDARLLTAILDDPLTPDRLERAVRDRVLVELGEGRDRFGFAHSLLRRVLVDQQPASARAAWHARIAAVLERHAATSEVVTTELVRHFAAADTPAALRKAYDHACRGAEQAARGLGWEEAVRLLEIALDVGSRCGAIDAERAVALQLALARALRGAGDIPAARARCEQVLAACRRTSRPTALAQAVLLHVGPTPQFGRVVPGDRALLEEACRGANALDDALRARLFARLAGDIFAANEPEQTERVLALCDQAAHAARRAGDAGALAMALLGTRYAAALRLRPSAHGAASEERRLPGTREIVAAAEAGGEHDIAAALRHLRAAGLFSIGDHDGFSAAIDGLAVAAATSHAPQALWLADCLGALRATVQGRFTEARELIERAHATGRRMQLPNASGQYFSQLIMWHHAQGRLAEIAPAIEAFVEQDPGGAGWQPARALARLACGDAAGARTELHTLLAAGPRATESGVMSRCHLAALALLCVALGERAHAPALLAQVARQNEEWIVDGSQTLGPWALVRGALGALCESAADAVPHFEQALAASRRVGARPFVALAQVHLAEALLASDPRAAADARVAALLDEAECCAAELGLAHVAARVASVRADVAGKRDAADSSLRCEGDVWTVAFGGRETRVKDGKGPAYLATLLAAPGREFHVFELASGGCAGETVASATEGLAVGGPGGALEDAPDPRATREYRARLDDLRAELDEAEQLCDRGRAERLRAELEFLVAQLAQRFGGRARTRGPAETARKAVTKVLRTQIGKLLDTHPELGEHLRGAVRMGTFCSYAPPLPTTWEVAFAGPVRPRARQRSAAGGSPPLPAR